MSSWLHCEVELAFLRFLFFVDDFCCVSVVSELVVVLESDDVVVSLSGRSSSVLWLFSPSFVFTSGEGRALFPSSGSLSIVFCNTGAKRVEEGKG